jgi:NarL family two-component system response regulator LiaR
VSGSIRVVIVDDHRMFTKALKLLLASEDGIEIVGEAHSGEDGVRLTKELRPDVLLMDVDLPDVNGIEAVRRLRQGDSEARVLMITAYQEDDIAVRAIEAGACGYVHKTRAPEELVEGIRVAAKGGIVLPSRQMASVLSRLQQHRNKRTHEERLLSQLTPRETEVLTAIASGMSTKEAASFLRISHQTLQKHVKSILAKLQVRSRLEAVTLMLSSDPSNRQDRSWPGRASTG